MYKAYIVHSVIIRVTITWNVQHLALTIQLAGLVHPKATK